MENHQFKVNIIYRCPFSLAILNYYTDLHGTNLRPNLLQKSSQHLLYLWEGKGWMKLSCCHNNGRPRHEKKQNRNIKKTCGYNLDIQWWDETFCRISCCSSTYVFMEIHRVWWFLNGFTMVYGSTRVWPCQEVGWLSFWVLGWCSRNIWKYIKMVAIYSHAGWFKPISLWFPKYLGAAFSNHLWLNLSFLVAVQSPER